jgi:hypothetical protein
MNAVFSNGRTYAEWYRNVAANYRSATEREQWIKTTGNIQAYVLLSYDVKYKNRHPTQNLFHSKI